jgi:hypothetical protein
VPQLSRLDWIVIVDVAIIVLVTVAKALYGGEDPRFVMWMVPLAVATWPILIFWMLKGGSASSLWTWLPPFWPWGRIVTSHTGRWCLVLVLIAGSILGSTSVVAKW